MTRSRRRWLVAVVLGLLGALTIALLGRIAIATGVYAGDFDKLAAGLADKTPGLQYFLLLEPDALSVFAGHPAAKLFFIIWLLLVPVCFKGVAPVVDRELFAPFSESPFDPITRPRSAIASLSHDAGASAALPWSLIAGSVRRKTWDDLVEAMAEDVLSPSGRGDGDQKIMFQWGVFTGPPGFGKSRLVTEMARRFARRDLVRVGRLDRRVRLAAWAREHLPGMRRRADVEGGVWSGDPWDAGRIRLNLVRTGLKGELRSWTPRRPTLLVLDDPVHGVAQAAVSALYEQAHRFRRPVRLLIVAQTIPADLRLRRERGVWTDRGDAPRHFRGVIRLPPDAVLGEGEVRQLTTNVRALYPTAKVRELLALTGGNPLLVELAIARVRKGGELASMTQLDLVREEGRRLRESMAEVGLGDTLRQGALACAHLSRSASRERLEEIAILPGQDVLALVFGHSAGDLRHEIPDIVPELIGDAFVDDLIEQNTQALVTKLVKVAWAANEVGLASTIARRPEPLELLWNAFEQGIADRASDNFLLGVFTAATRHWHAEELCREILRANSERAHRLLPALVDIAVADGILPGPTFQIVMVLLDALSRTPPLPSDLDAIVDLVLHLELPTESQVVSWPVGRRADAGVRLASGLRWSCSAGPLGDDRAEALADALQAMPAGLGGAALAALADLVRARAGGAVRMSPPKSMLLGETVRIRTGAPNGEQFAKSEATLLGKAVGAWTDAPDGEQLAGMEAAIERLEALRSSAPSEIGSNLEWALSSLTYAHYRRHAADSLAGCRAAADRCLAEANRLRSSVPSLHVAAAYRYVANTSDDEANYGSARAAADLAGGQLAKTAPSPTIVGEVAHAWASAASAAHGLAASASLEVCREISAKVAGMTAELCDDADVLARVIDCRAALLRALGGARPVGWSEEAHRMVAFVDGLRRTAETGSLDLAICNFWIAWATIVATNRTRAIEDCVEIGERVSAIAAPYFDDRRIRRLEARVWHSVLSSASSYRLHDVALMVEGALARIDDVCARFPGDPWFEIELVGRVAEEVRLFGLASGPERARVGLRRLAKVNVLAMSPREMTRARDSLAVIRVAIESSLGAVVTESIVKQELLNALAECDRLFCVDRPAANA